ncbi:MAG: hypothetical protein KUG78_03555 [Kangiellaceae bacterium]|nr:hypothetical protein [Kangiellaceae bacterium]
MEKYISFGGDPKVSAFDILSDSIRIHLANGDIFLYSNSGAGAHNIEQMKSIAVNGGPLNNYILNNMMGRHDLKITHYDKNTTG